MFETATELQQLTTPQLKSLLVEAYKYKGMTSEEKYHSNLYKLLSDMTEIYGNHMSLRLLVDNLAIESARRLTNNIINKQS